MFSFCRVAKRAGDAHAVAICKPLPTRIGKAAGGRDSRQRTHRLSRTVQWRRPDIAKNIVGVRGWGLNNYDVIVLLGVNGCPATDVFKDPPPVTATPI